MKKITLIISCFLICINTFSQVRDRYFSTLGRQIFNDLEKQDYYNAIAGMDVFLRVYPDDSIMWYFRGMAKFMMNDIPAASIDLIKAQQMGYHQNDNFINMIISKDYQVNMLAKDYIDDVNILKTKDFKPVFSLKDSLRGALRPERTCYDVYYYNLTLKILPESKSIEGRNEIYFTTMQNTIRIQVDLTGKLQIDSITCKGRELNFTRIFDAVFVDFDDTLPAGKDLILAVSYSGTPREAPSPPWNGGFVWKNNKKRQWTGVACEHLGASAWWPCKDYLGDKPDSMCINIQVPTGYQAIANGNLRSSRAVDDQYTNFEWFVSYPINSYGVTFYVGDFVNFNEMYTHGGSSFPIDYYVLPKHLKAARKYYQNTKDVIAVYEDLYGEYPYKKDGAAMVEAPYEGMEHQSAIAIGDVYKKKNREDRPSISDGFDYLLVHETAHEWWGNTVTMSDMADAWISEGFATYSEALFAKRKMVMGNI